MSLSAREQRILDEIERELEASGPLGGHLPWRLRRLLTVRRRPGKRRLRKHDDQGNPGDFGCAGPADRGTPGTGWFTAVIASFAVGIGVLTAGVVTGIAGLMAAGALLATFGPVAVGRLAGQPRRSTLSRLSLSRLRRTRGD